jgi:hypothetical protein
MFHKVQAVQPLPDYSLLVSFENSEQKKYNIKPLFDKWEAFKALSTITGLFEQVNVDAGGYGVSWNDEIDLSCNELYENGVDVSNSLLAWDPDFAKLTPSERERLIQADNEFENGETVNHNAINWD